MNINLNSNLQSVKFPIVFRGTQNPQEVQKNDESDTFVRMVPSTTQELEKQSQRAAQKIYDDPNALERLARFTTGVFTELYRRIRPDENIEDKISDNRLASEVVDTFIKTETPDDNNVTVLGDTPEEADVIEAEVVSSENVDKDIKIIPPVDVEIPEHVQVEDEDLVFAKFPPKGCRLTNDEKDLKALLEEMKLPQDYAEKMTGICSKLFGKDVYNIDDKQVSAKKITPVLVEELINAENMDAVKEVIDKYDSILAESVVKDASVPAAPTEENSDKVEPTAAQEPEDPNFIPLPNKPEIKVVGQINDVDKRNERVHRIVRDKDGNITHMFYKNRKKVENGQPVPRDDVRMLNRVLRYFVSKYYCDFKDRQKLNPELTTPKWRTGQSLPYRISKSEVLDEITSQNKDPKTAYKNITLDDADELVDVINGERKFLELFSLHGALRLIDRYADIENGSLERQVAKLTKKLTKIIDNAFEKGVMIQVYQDENNKYAPRIILNADDFDQEAKRLFGTTNLVVGLSERQEGSGYVPVDNKDKKAIITTVFSRNE